MNYHEAITTIRTSASHIGQCINRSQAIAALTGDARKAATVNNPLNTGVAQYRLINGYVVELALSDWTGMRGGSYMCGITVWKGSTSHHSLSACVALDEIADKLRSIASITE